MDSRSCSICLENIDGNINKVITECNHTFHFSCIMKYTQTISQSGNSDTVCCPNCRDNMTKEKGQEKGEENKITKHWELIRELCDYFNGKNEAELNRKYDIYNRGLSKALDKSLKKVKMFIVNSQISKIPPIQKEEMKLYLEWCKKPMTEVPQHLRYILKIARKNAKKNNIIMDEIMDAVNDYIWIGDL